MDRLAELINLQSGVISRVQALEHGLTDNDVRRMLRRRELVRVHPGVYVGQTGEPTWLQRAWAGVLFAWPAALSHDSALRAAEGPGRDHPSSSRHPIHVAIDRDRRLSTPEGVRLHRMTGFTERTLWNSSPPRIRYDEAALDVAAGAATDFQALGIVARACQSRRTTALRMQSSLAARPRSARRTWLSSVLSDVAEGACSVLEWGYLRHVERAHGLPRADRQRRVNGTLGVTYRDAQYRTLVLELDGRLFHDTAGQRDRDLDRDLDAAAAGEGTVRIGYGQVFDRPCETARRIGVLLQRHGWPGTPRPCGPDCTVRWPAVTG